ncbi:MAG: hypothetical protein WCB90_13670 [Methanosarcina sp.]|uniref:hypothetical protein n=1 Tax=Methanosarcina sp. TaxID=2213 RepID=UPI003BB4EA97
MKKLIKIVGYAVASVGITYAVKQIIHHKKCCCGWHKIKVEDEKPTDKDESHKTKEEGEKITGSRYGSNPVKY